MEKVDINYERVKELSYSVTRDIENMDTILQEIYNRMKTLDEVWLGPTKDTVTEGFEMFRKCYEPLKQAGLNYSKFLDYVITKYKAEDKMLSDVIDDNAGKFGAM